MNAYLQFLRELKRRSVFKVAVAYGVSAWLFVQVASIVIPAFELPGWSMRAVLIALAAGFPTACLLAWVYERTADGLRIDRRGEPGPPDAALDSDRSPLDRLGVRERLLVAIVLVIAIVGGLTSVYATRSPATPHLAVLPFRVVSEEPEARILAAGLVETLTSTVTQFGQFDKTLWVVPSSEITGPMTPSAARQRFGVSVVVTGSIQFDADRIRLTLNLIDADTERQLYARQLDVRKQSLIELQDEATHHLAQMLNLRLSPGQSALLARGRTRNPDAERFNLQGRGVLRQATSVAALDEAIELFERALQADSLFALAHAGLGDAYWQKYRQTEDIQWVDAAIRYSQRSLAIDSTLAPVWVTLGVIRSDQRHDDAALSAFDRALDIDPGYADAYRHRATVYRRQGAWDRAEAAYRQAITRQPEYWKGYNALGVFYYSQGQYAAAIDQYTHGLRLAPANPSLLNNVAVAYWQMHRLDEAMPMFERVLMLDSTRSSAQANLATAYFYQHRFDDAARLYAQAVAQHPQDYTLVGALADAQMWSTDQRAAAPSTYARAIALAKKHLSFRGQDPLILGSLAQYYVRLGNPDSARVWLRRAEPLVDSSAVDVTLAFGMGELYESLGERERARAWIRRALDRDYGLIPLRHSPWLTGLRTDPEIRRLLNPTAL